MHHAWNPTYNIGKTTGPTKMVHLSIFPGFHEENSQKTFKCPTQKIKILIRARLKKLNPNFRFLFYFTVPRLLQKGSRLGMSNERSSNCGLMLIQKINAWFFHEKHTFLCTLRSGIQTWHSFRQSRWDRSICVVCVDIKDRASLGESTCTYFQMKTYLIFMP